MAKIKFHLPKTINKDGWYFQTLLKKHNGDKKQAIKSIRESQIRTGAYAGYRDR